MGYIEENENYYFLPKVQPFRGYQLKGTVCVEMAAEWGLNYSWVEIQCFGQKLKKLLAVLTSVSGGRSLAPNADH